MADSGLPADVPFYGNDVDIRYVNYLRSLLGIQRGRSLCTALRNVMSVNGVTWMLFENGHVLMERCPNKAAMLGVGEQWFIPGGKLERGETPEAALRREIAEEWPGVELLTFLPLPIVEGSAVPPGPKGVFLMRPYLITVRGEVASISGDGIPLSWRSIAEALASPVTQVRMMVAAAGSIHAGREAE